MCIHLSFKVLIFSFHFESLHTLLDHASTTDLKPGVHKGTLFYGRW